MPPRPLPPLLLAVALAAAAPLAAQAAQGPPPPQDPPGHRPYDPLGGMDRDGRIPKPQFPPDLAHPDRWRYTPPGRIKPGSLFDRFLVSSFVSPILFREEDIGFGGGFALTDVDFRDQRYREFANALVTYSEEGQQAYRLNWSKWLEHRELDNGGVIREERNRLFGRIGYEKTLTRRFFGFGSRTAEADETSYTEEVSGAGFGARISLPDPGSDWLLRTDLRAERHGLSQGRVSTVPSTEQVYPDVFRDGDGVDQLWLDTSFGWDSRDSLHQPYRGTRFGGSANVAYGSGGEFGAVVGVDAQHVIPLPTLVPDRSRGSERDEENPPTDVLVLGAFVVDTLGDLPFHNLPTLGGTNTLRGYIQHRFTDRAAAHAAAEYRFGLIPRGITFTDTVRIERVSMALFYEAGTVAGGAEDLHQGRYLDSYGFGFRLAFAREAVFRIDWGLSDEGPNFTLAFGNSF